MPFSRGKYYILQTPMFIYTQSLGYIRKITTLKVAEKRHSIEKKIQQKLTTDDPYVRINRQDL